MPHKRLFPTIALSALPNTVLLISRDPALQVTRTLILEREGYTAIALGSEAAVAEFLCAKQQPALSLVLLCHSLPEASRIALCRLLKARRPAVPILLLFPGFGSTSAAVDGAMQNVDSPAELLAIVRHHVSLAPHGRANLSRTAAGS